MATLGIVNRRVSTPLISRELSGAPNWPTRGGWTPTPNEYLGNVSKAKAIEAVQQACGLDASEARTVAAMKWVETVAYCEKKLYGLRWLPEPLTVPAQAVVDGAA